MSDKNFPSGYQPEEIWQYEGENGGQFAGINRPTAGARHEQALARGEHPMQLYSLATPNGVKVTIMLEELLQLGFAQAQYDAHLINITEGEQFSTSFVQVNPNSKIPALVDYNGETPIRVFESGAILQYLAHKFSVLMPESAAQKAECLSWLFWQVGSAPYVGGGFGHFYRYAPMKIQYCIDRFAMEVKRQFDVLNQHLADKQYLCSDEYSIADIACWPWYAGVLNGAVYQASEFLSTHQYPHVQRWAERIGAREAVQRGKIVNRVWGDEDAQLKERHSASDIDAVLAKQKT